MEWPCFLLTPTQTARRNLRRYAFDLSCPARGDGGRHEATATIGDFPVLLTAGGALDSVPIDPSDPAWQQVATCACGYSFTEDDAWMIGQEVYYTDPVGSRYLLIPAGPLAAPAGAMWEAPWSGTLGDWCGPDGKAWVVRLPDGGDWTVDAPTVTGGGWTREGVAPALTVRPSILSRGYHGWLTNGFLSHDLEGRTYGR